MTNIRPVYTGQQLATSMRSVSYRNTIYALAEIIDNSVEAESKHIEILCAEKQNYSSQRITKRLEKIAIIDDGVGMNKNELWNSLTAGAGTHRETKGIGKFGLGLPQSSMSQCKHVTVYSWLNPNEILFSEININDNTADGLGSTEPQKTELPKLWKNKSKYLKNSKSGTMVIWEDIDKIRSKKSKTLVKNLEKLVGRIYRKFIHNNNLKISVVTFDLDTNEMAETHNIHPNDPLYQMVPTRLPPPWDKTPMFQIDGDKLEDVVSVDGHDVIIRCTFATKEARTPINGQLAGSLTHGKHANSNLGVSLIRANRELYVDTNLCQTYDPLERWWGVELEFPTALDDVFGVSNTKQDANNFSAMTQEIGAISRNEEQQDYDDDDDDLDDLRKLVIHINARIRAMRTRIKRTNAGPKKNSDRDSNPYPDTDTSPTRTEEQENMSNDEKEKVLTEALSKIFDPEKASVEAKLMLTNKVKTQLITAQLANNYFFDVDFQSGLTIITLNELHPAYKHIVGAIEKIPEDIDMKDIKNIMNKLRVAINLMFVSWAYYENHSLSDDELRNLRNVRFDWSRRLAELMKTLEN